MRRVMGQRGCQGKLSVVGVWVPIELVPSDLGCLYGIVDGSIPPTADREVPRIAF